MKLLSIEVQNFLKHKNLKFIFPKGKEVFAITGENEAGKSTLFTAIAYAIFGSEACEVSKSLLTHSGTKEHRVILEFELNSIPYTIDRSSKFLHLYKGVTQISATNTQKEIDSLIGCSYNTFSNCVYYKQNAASFIQIPSNLKLKFFEELFTNSELEKAKEVSEIEYKKFESEYSVLDRQKDKLLNEIDSRKANITAWNGKSNTAQESVLENDYSKDRLKELEELYSSQARVVQRREQLRNDYKNKKNELNNIAKEVINLDKAICYACNQSIKKDKAKLSSLEENKERLLFELEKVLTEGESLKSSNWSDFLEKELKGLQDKKQNFLIAQDRTKEFSEMAINEVQLLGLAKTELRKLESELEEKATILEASRKTKEMLSNKGLKRLWIESIVNVLNERINEIASVFGAKISIEIDIDKRNNPFSIYYNSLPMPLPSGGATRICELVLFFAFNSIANTPFQFVILDEVFENLDEKNRSKMWEIINSVDYLQTYIVSHLDIETQNKFIVTQNQIKKL